MKSKKTQQRQVSKVDLTKIDGKGEFPCPKCGAKISPDDQTENTYSILEPKVKGTFLEEVLIRCNKCTRHISLVGFAALFAQTRKGKISKK
jgi:predicted RNA-binding Zn-ribbon protein involved in translation (DUF1610 family)